MADFPTHKRVPGSTGGDTTPRVKVSTPIPLREVPLKGLKTMAFPKASAREILPGIHHGGLAAGAEVPLVRRLLLRISKGMFWLIVLALSIILFLAASMFLFTMLTGF